MNAKNWKLSGNFLDRDVDLIQQKFSLPRPVAVFFASRGIGVDKVRDFINPRLANLSDPYRFPGIKDASARLWQAIADREPILIHGDYDTDGITASALLALVLRQNGAVVSSATSSTVSVSGTAERRSSIIFLNLALSLPRSL